jgi:hypothetical protein
MILKQKDVLCSASVSSKEKTLTQQKQIGPFHMIRIGSLGQFFFTEYNLLHCVPFSVPVPENSIVESYKACIGSDDPQRVFGTYIYTKCVKCRREKRTVLQLSA